MSGFGPDNLPYGVFSVADGKRRIGTRLGTEVVDLSHLGGELAASTLNTLMAAGRPAWEATRARVRDAVERGAAETLPLDSARLHLPFAVADYVDFYSSLEHATNMGRLFRPDSDPLLPNWRRLPVGYHGRAGTVVVSGTPVRRPWGQAKPPDEDDPCSVRRSGSMSSSSSGSSSAPAARWESRCHRRASATTSSASSSSTTGARGTSRRGSTSRSGRSSASRSRPRSARG